MRVQLLSLRCMNIFLCSLRGDAVTSPDLVLLVSWNEQRARKRQPPPKIFQESKAEDQKDRDSSTDSRTPVVWLVL